MMLKRLLLAAVLALSLADDAYAVRSLKDITCETTSTTGTGTLSLGGAYQNNRTFAAQVTSGDEVSYNIRSGDGKRETGSGVFTDSAPDTLARTSNIVSTDGTGTKLSLTGTSVVCLGFISAWTQPNLGTGDTPQFGGLEVGHATQNSIACSAGHCTVEGATIWDSGNDGSGSGLDADTLDAISSASFVQTSRTLTGGVGIAAIGDLSADRTVTFDATELGALTWGSGSGFAHTFNAGATDPVWTYGSASTSLSNSDLFLADGNGFAIGASTLLTDTGGQEFQIVGTADGDSSGVFSRFSANTSPSRLDFTKSRNASAGSHTIVQSGDSLGEIRAYGSDGTNYDQGASISFVVDGAPSSGADMPTAIYLGTSADGSATTTTRWILGSAGHLVPNADITYDIGTTTLGVRNIYVGTSGSTFNDYDVGTWTPTLTTAGTNFTSVTYSAERGGRYTRIGNVVHIQGWMWTDAVTVGSASGNVVIGGLPFTAVSSGGSTRNGDASISVAHTQNWTGEEPTKAYIAANSTLIGLLYQTSVSGDVASTAVADVGTGADANLLMFAGTYLVP